MKTKVLVIVFVVVSLFAFALWLSRNRQVESSDGQTDTITGPHERGVAEQPSSDTRESYDSFDSNDLDIVSEFQNTSPNQDLQRRLEDLARSRGVSLNVITQEAVMQWSNLWHQAGHQINGQIEFFGKVMDENELPVERAHINFSWLAFPEKECKTNTLADAQGLFTLNNATGMVLFVSVSKEGYEQESNPNRFEYHMYGFEGFRADPRNPVIFHLRKKPAERK